MSLFSDVYVSVDIEADGPVAGINNMLSLGASAYTLSEHPLEWTQQSVFYNKILPQPEFTSDWRTMNEFWAKQPKAYKEVQTNQLHPNEVMHKFVSWLKSLGNSVVFVGTPAVWDFSFVFYYCMKYVGECPFGHRGLDIRSFLAGYHGLGFYGNASTKATFKREFSTYKNPFEHHALEDAVEQGHVMMNALVAGYKRYQLTKEFKELMNKD